MDDIRENGIFKKHKENIEIESFDLAVFFQKIEEKGYSKNLNKSLRRVINWDSIEEKHSFLYDYEGCETDVGIRLSKSKLKSEKYLWIEYGSEYPILKVGIDFFISNWYDFVMLNSYLGFTAITDSGKCLMEFTDTSDYLLYTNFLL